MILASMKTASKPNHSNNLIICKTYLHCDKSKFFVRRPCFFVVPNLSFIWVLGTRAYSRNLGQCSILARRRSQPPNPPPPPPPLPYSIPFLSVLHQNKALHDFHKRGQHSIVKHRSRICSEYAPNFLKNKCNGRNT